MISIVICRWDIETTISKGSLCCVFKVDEIFFDRTMTEPLLWMNINLLFVTGPSGKETTTFNDVQ